MFELVGDIELVGEGKTVHHMMLCRSLSQKFVLLKELPGTITFHASVA